LKHSYALWENADVSFVSGGGTMGSIDFNSLLIEGLRGKRYYGSALAKI